MDQLPDDGQLARDNGPLLDRGRTLAITTPEQLIEAKELVVQLATRDGRVVEWFRDIKANAAALHKSLCAREREFRDPIAGVRARLTVEILAYEDRARAAAESENLRLAQAARKADEERRLDLAESAEADGQPDVAEAILTAPLVVPVAHAIPAIPKVAGVGHRETWKTEVVNFAALVAYVAEHQDKLGLLVPNDAALRSYAQSLKGAAAIPGVRFYPVGSLSVRRQP